MFSEWTFPQNNAFIHRKDYSFVELLDEKPKRKKKSDQQSLFDMDEPELDGEGKFVEEYVCHYRKLGAIDTTEEEDEI